MARIRVVMVEPLYQINLGYVARAAMNFGVTELVLVRPRCKPEGKQAIKYSKHALQLLKDARLSGSIEDAIKGTFAIGTTGVWRKSRNSFRNIFYPSDVAAIISKNRVQDISVVLGRDDTGLTADEMRLFDAICFIPASEVYPVLNISHALAIMLYALTQKEAPHRYNFGRFYADGHEIDALLRSFDAYLGGTPNVRDRAAVAAALKHILGRAAPTKKEVNALHAAFSVFAKSKDKRTG